MGCHTLDAAFWALKLGEAERYSVEATSTGHEVVLGAERVAVLAPSAREPAGRAAVFGADTAPVLSRAC